MDPDSQSGPTLEKLAELSSMQEEMTRAKLAFHEKFQRTLAFQKLSPMSRYQPRPSGARRRGMPALLSCRDWPKS
jgi:hypothetical protein